MTLATLLLAAHEEAPPPLIDLDGTAVVQFALFVIMLLVLSRLLFRPYLALRDARHHGIEGARQQAEALRHQATDADATYHAKLGQARLRGNEERQALRSEGASIERQALGRAREEAQAALAQARQKIADETGRARATLAAESTALAQKIVEKVLGHEAAQ